MSKPDTNQASEDELDIRIKELLIALLLMNQRDPDGIDEYVEFCVEDTKKLIRTEKLKAQTAILQEGISESKEFCGEDVDINLGWVSFKLNELQQSLNKLEAEL